MAIKIKKKGDKPEEEPEVEEVAEDAPATARAAAQLSEEADPFLRASWETASWVEEHRFAVIGGVVAVFVAILSAYMGLNFLENSKVEASTTLSPAFDSYNTLLEGSKQLEAIKANPDFEAPKTTYPNEEARWQAVYDAASKSLDKNKNNEVAHAARLAKASAASRLGKHDEAIQLFEEYRKSSSDKTMEVVVLQGIASTHADAEKWDDAIKALDDIAKADEELASAVMYQKARILERAGRAEPAKELYHKILDESPTHPQKSDIERRLATM